MDWWHKLLFLAFIILAASIDEAEANSKVTGTVFCDQCKDGKVSLFDYPLAGVKVMISCSDTRGKITMTREETTNFFGNYAMNFAGAQDLSNCHAQVLGNGSSNSCHTVAGPAQKLKLMFRMFDTEMYSVDSLLSAPAKPMSICPKSNTHVPTAPVAPKRSPPPFKLPPLPQIPLLQEKSACPYQKWTKPEYKCYWRALNPNSKVAVVFGPVAGAKYGSNMTLWQGLQGRGDPYRTLLREATTSLLNSYNSLDFPYHTIDVFTSLNSALKSSTRSTLLTAMRLMKANSGSGQIPCKFTPCK